MRNACYTCVHRRDVPGDAHSSCAHPKNEPFVELVKFVAGLPTELNIKADEHGVKSGWFLYPINFDPVWLENCEGYTKKP